MDKVIFAAVLAVTLVFVESQEPHHHLPAAQHSKAPASTFGGPSGYPRQGRPSGSPGFDDSEPAKYEFKYLVDEPEYKVKFGHQESRAGDVTQGSYHVLLPDGRTQHVQYVADQGGYRPKVTYQHAQGQY